MSSHGNVVPSSSESPKAATGKATFTIRPLQDSDVAEVVEIHIRAIPYSINSLLGRSHLADVYRGLIRSDDAVSLVAANSSGRILGVVTGVTDLGRVLRTVMRVGVLLKLPVRLASNPLAVFEGLRVVFRQTTRHPRDIQAILTSIAVADMARGKGVGTQLVEALEAVLKDRGIREYWLEAKADNSAAIEFYNNLGFTEFSRGRRDICFHKLLVV